MIERVHCAPRSGGGNAVDCCGNLRLDVARLYLDVKGGARADCVKNLLKRRKGDAGSKLEIVELGQRKGRDGATGNRGIGSRRKHMIVMDDDHAVAGPVNIELDSVYARIECRLEGQKRILGVSVANAAVGNYFRNAQLFPSAEVGCWIMICVNVFAWIASNMRVE